LRVTMRNFSHILLPLLLPSLAVLLELGDRSFFAGAARVDDDAAGSDDDGADGFDDDDPPLDASLVQDDADESSGPLAGISGEHPLSKYLNPEILFELRCVHCLMTAAKMDYFISEGTLLGTVRDGFLLPWDGDGDIVFEAKDYDAFYKVFSPGPIGTGDYAKCPKCNKIQVGLFTPGLKINGVQMNFFSSYDEILSGNLSTLKGCEKIPAPKEMHDSLLDLSKRPNSARIHWNTDSRIRNGGHGYLDVAPFFKNASEIVVLENVTKRLAQHDVYPLVDCKAKVFTPHNKLRSVTLRCPKNPRPYLDQTYEKGWAKAPFNKYVDGQGWLEGTLEDCVRTMYNYTGPLEHML